MDNHSSPDDAPFPLGSLVFVTYNNEKTGRDHDAETKRLVRKRAFDASRGTGAQKSNVGRRRLTPIIRHSLKDGQGRFRLPKDSSASYEGALQSELIPASLSTFEPIIGRLGSDAWGLLSYYTYNFFDNSLACNVEGKWMAFSLSDEATSHALLALVALTKELDLPGSASSLAAKHASAAVHVLRNRLQENPSSPEDSLVGATAVLTIVESMQDDKDVSSAHFNGLNKMLAIRGGYDAFSHLRVLQRVIAWARRCYCLRWHEPQRLPPLPQNHEEKLENSKNPFRRSSNSEYYSAIISRELGDILDSFQTIAAFPPQHLCSEAQRRALSQAIYDVEYRLMSLNQGHLAGLFGLSSTSNSFSKVFQLAAQIYVLIVLRQIQWKASVVQVYARALSTEIQNQARSFNDLLKGLPRSHQCLLLWIETLHFVSAIDTDSKNRSRRALRVLLKAMHIVKFEDFMKCLKEVAWMDGTFEKNFANFLI